MFRKQHPEAGARPGTLLIPSDAVSTKVRVVTYSRERVREVRDCDPGQIELPEDSNTVTWIDVRGYKDVALLETLASRFQIHPLALEDVVNEPQRPKAEMYDDHQLIVSRVVAMPASMDLQIRQLSIFLGPNYVITFQSTYSDLLNPVRQRLNRDSSRLRANGADYLAYALLDTAVDAYYPVIERLGELMEQLEYGVIHNPRPELLQRLNRVKNRLVNLRRCVWPQRDALQSLMSDENDLIGDDVQMYLRDTHDHCVQTSEVIEMYREMAMGLMNTYLSSVAHRSNEVMKVLTVVSSIFVPLTFLAGIYGMNFEHMPELEASWSYPTVWVAMLGIAGSMIWFFRQKGWIGLAPLDNEGAYTASENKQDPTMSISHTIGDQSATRPYRKSA